MKVTEQELIEKCGIEGYYVLSNKQVTNKYYDIKSLQCSNHNLVLDYFEERINSDFDMIVSAELGGSLIAAALSERLDKPFAVLRKDRPNIGCPHGKVLMIDDVCTSYNIMNKMIKWIKDCNASISQIIIAIDRRQKNINKDISDNNKK